MTPKKYPSLAQLFATGAMGSIARSVSPNAALVFATLRHHQRGKEMFSLSRAGLAAKSGVTVRRVNDVLDRLVAAGVVEINGRGRRRTYTLREPSRWLIQVTHPKATSRLVGRSGRSAREEKLVCLTTREEMGLEGPDERVKIKEFVRRRSTYKAADGHVCESRGAAMVCDRLCRQKIPHDVEVAYAQLGVKPALDKRGRVKPWRADLVLRERQLIIEIVGGFGGDYAANVEAKRRAAIEAGWKVLLWSDEELEDLDRTLRKSGLWQKAPTTDSSLYSQGTPRPGGEAGGTGPAGNTYTTVSGARQGTSRPVPETKETAPAAGSSPHQGTPRPARHGPPSFVRSLGRVVSPGELDALKNPPASSKTKHRPLPRLRRSVLQHQDRTGATTTRWPVSGLRILTTAAGWRRQAARLMNPPIEWRVPPIWCTRLHALPRGKSRACRSTPPRRRPRRTPHGRVVRRGHRDDPGRRGVGGRS